MDEQSREVPNDETPRAFVERMFVEESDGLILSRRQAKAINAAVEAERKKPRERVKADKSK